MEWFFENHDKQSYSSCYECPPGMRGKTSFLPDNPYNPYSKDYSDVIKKYENFPTFGYPKPDDMLRQKVGGSTDYSPRPTNRFSTEKMVIQCVPCAAGRFMNKFGYPHSPTWNEVTRELDPGKDCNIKKKNEDGTFSYDPFGECTDLPCYGCPSGQYSDLYAIEW